LSTFEPSRYDSVSIRLAQFGEIHPFIAAPALIPVTGYLHRHLKAGPPPAEGILLPHLLQVMTPEKVLVNLKEDLKHLLTFGDNAADYAGSLPPALW
jgi:hypothetical protein